MGICRETKNDIKELLTLIKMTEQHEALIANSVMSLDSQPIDFNDQRLICIEELLRQYDVSSQFKGG
ncbi:hypothetical protein [Pseudomonas sp. B21-048]|uniref:hypothetical protein n=1 Tax=Pseudomonas sp. B21-048 TaxID=2895490 RepID=UPI00215EDB53|nr:hypothetical protein [Pseudomonas sp. B21-048]UVL01107.1 hypothetical protein LOY56_12530 [Pseudomonas sp. B21-048]